MTRIKIESTDHWHQLRRQHVGGKHIPLSRGLWAIVDEQDYAELSKYTWYAEPRKHLTYAVRTVGHPPNRLKIYMHRSVVGAGKGQKVDHINGDGLNNRRSNLRLCRDLQNLWNQGLRSDNRSGFKGVVRSRSGRWRAEIQVRGRRISIGTFDTAVEAAAAYDQAALHYFGEFARTNAMLGGLDGAAKN